MYVLPVHVLRQLEEQWLIDVSAKSNTSQAVLPPDRMTLKHRSETVKYWPLVASQNTNCRCCYSYGRVAFAPKVEGQRYMSVELQKTPANLSSL